MGEKCGMSKLVDISNMKVVDYSLGKDYATLYLLDEKYAVMRCISIRVDNSGLTILKSMQKDNTRKVENFPCASLYCGYPVVYYFIGDSTIIGDKDCDVEIKEIKKSLIKAKLGSNIREFVINDFKFLKVRENLYFVVKTKYDGINGNVGYLRNACKKFAFSGDKLKEIYWENNNVARSEVQFLSSNFMECLVIYNGVMTHIVYVLRNLIQTVNTSMNIIAVYEDDKILYVLAYKTSGLRKVEYFLYKIAIDNDLEVVEEIKGGERLVQNLFLGKKEFQYCASLETIVHISTIRYWKELVGD
jgi:hypothetical protein